jgi:hypothetical protein
MTHWTRAASRRFVRLGRVGWIAAAVFCGASALMTAWVLLVWEGSYQTKPLDEIASLVCLVFAAGCAAKATHSTSGRRSYGWLALVVALSAWAVGEVVQMFTEVRQDGHLWHPSLTQGILMVFPAAAYACLLLLGDLEKASRKRMILDGIIVAASLIVVSWVCVLRKLPGDGGASGVTVLHITIDVVLMTTAILVWSRPLSRVSVTVLAAGITTLEAADIASVYLAGVGGYHNGGVIDIVRVAGFGMLAFAALFSVDERPVQPLAMNLQAGVAAIPAAAVGRRRCDHFRTRPQGTSGAANGRGRPRRRGGFTAVLCTPGEPATAHRGRPRGVSRQPDRPGEPRELSRPAGPRDGPAPPQRRTGGSVVPRPRQFQSRQRCAGPPRG